MITFTVNYIALIYCMIGIICGCVGRCLCGQSQLKTAWNDLLARHRQAESCR